MANRLVFVDDVDPRIAYTGPWIADRGSRDTVGNFGAPFANTLHGTQGSASLSLTFTGTGFIAFSSNNPTEVDGVVDPQWQCFVDGQPVPSNGYFPHGLNNYHLCETFSLSAGRHTLRIDVTIRHNQTFWFDSIQYAPSGQEGPRTMLIEPTDTVLQNSMAETGGWTPWGPAVFMTRETDTPLRFNFIGTVLQWYGSIPEELPRGATTGTYSIDGGEPVTFNLNGLPGGNQISLYCQMFFQTPTLPAGTHSMEVIYRGSDGVTPLTLDYLVIFGSSTGSPIPFVGPAARPPPVSEPPASSSTTATLPTTTSTSSTTSTTTIAQTTPTTSTNATSTSTTPSSTSTITSSTTSSPSLAQRPPETSRAVTSATSSTAEASPETSIVTTTSTLPLTRTATTASTTRTSYTTSTTLTDAVPQLQSQAPSTTTTTHSNDAQFLPFGVFTTSSNSTSQTPSPTISNVPADSSSTSPDALASASFLNTYESILVGTLAGLAVLLALLFFLLFFRRHRRRKARALAYSNDENIPEDPPFIPPLFTEKKGKGKMEKVEGGKWDYAVLDVDDDDDYADLYDPYLRDRPSSMNPIPATMGLAIHEDSGVRLGASSSEPIEVPAGLTSLNVTHPSVPNRYVQVPPFYSAQ